jgi:hypothetical protein
MGSVAHQGAKSGRAKASDRAAVDALARELNLSVEQVEPVYAAEASRIEADARITTFVSVIVAGRVRSELRRLQRTD